MNVQVRIRVGPKLEEQQSDLRSLARCLTRQPESIRVSADPERGWVVVDFTMPTEAQSKAVSKIQRELRLCVRDRDDCTIRFPPTEEERERAVRKAEVRRWKRLRDRESPTAEV